jgi:hypothetical protein
LSALFALTQVAQPCAVAAEEEVAVSEVALLKFVVVAAAVFEQEVRL